MNISFPQTQTILVCQSGPRAGERFQIGESEMRIGSGPDNNIIIQDQSILPRHASLFWHQGHLAIVSLHAHASVLVNQRLIPPQGIYLNAGDRIDLGQSGNVFQLVTSNNLSGLHVAEMPAPPETPSFDVYTATLKPVVSSSATSSTSPTSSTSFQQTGLPGAGNTQKSSETTRYLCMAARISQSFRDYVFKHIVREKHRDVGESHGVDMLAVVKSCYSAQRQVFFRASILCVLLAIQLLSFIITIYISIATFIANYTANSYSPSTILLLILTSVLIVVLRLVFSVLFISLAYIKKIPVPIRVILLLIAILLFAGISNFYLTIFLYLAAWGVIVWNLWNMYYGAEAQQLAKDKFHPGNIQFPLDQQVELELGRLSDPQQNVIVYSGYSPFVGSGINIDGWSFAIDATKGRQKAGATLTAEPFQVADLYACVQNDMQALNLPDLNISDKLYVNGKAISNKPAFFDNHGKRPLTSIKNTLVTGWMEKFSEDVRYYKCFRMISWKGELMVSIFVRFMQIEKNLFIEANYMVLPPLKEEYYFLDTIEPTFTLEKLWNLVRSSFFSVFPLWLLSPWHIVTYLTRDWSAMRELRQVERLIDRNPAFDYGASISLREFASSPGYQLHFQKLDEEMYVKTIERQLLESIVNFLDSKNIDTSGLKDRQETILNHGVIVSGGTFTGNFAIGGEQAKVISNRKDASA